MSRAAYEIRATGAVPASLLDDFAGVTVAADPVGTTIRADLADEAELHGLLDALSREGFALVDVRREPSSDLPERPRHADRSRGHPDGFLSPDSRAPAKPTRGQTPLLDVRGTL